MISLATTIINEEVWENVQECLDTGMIGGGRFIEKFEKRVAHFIKIKHAIAVCSGTMADAVALAALKIRYPKKREVILPALTFVAQANAVIMNGLKPVFVDVKSDYQMKTHKLPITEKTLAVMPAHLLGKRFPVWNIKRDVPIVEDCCEAFGNKPKLIGTYSFFPSHTISTGEGGMIVTDNDELAELCRKIKNHGRRSNYITEKFKFDIFGFNAKMSNLTAAVGAGIVKEAKNVIEKRKRNIQKLNEITGQKWYADSPHCYPMVYDLERERNLKLLELENAGIEARKLFSSLPTQESAFKNLKYKLGDFPVAEHIGERGLFVPIHQDLNEQDIRTIGNIIKKRS